MLLALALYAYDAVLFLERTQAVVVRDRQGWRASFGLRSWTIGGREPWFPNPLKGHRPAYVVNWPMLAEPQTSAAVQLDETLDFKIIGSCVLLSTFCLFVLLPLGLFTRAGSVLTLFVIALMTVSTGVAVGVAARHKERLRLSQGKLWSLAIECLLCPPFSLNLVRRICALQAIDEEIEPIAARLFTRAAQQQMHEECLLRVDEALALFDEDSAEHALLKTTRLRFQPSELQP